MMFDFRRSHACDSLRLSDVGSFVTLAGWVHRFRDHGGLIFIDLRDRFGLTQLVFDPEKDLAVHAIGETLRSEWVIAIKGEVIPRREGMANPKLQTGDIEVMVKEIEVLSQAKTPPFSICDETLDVNEELRLKYRYLDLRRGRIARHLRLRHKATMVMRNYLDRQDFLEITTPFLGKSTPEGARDYLVPSRLTPGQFYALPQSPQLFKQLLMVGGMERYFQIATCFRDEDLRANRQPEFAQVDLEMSFATPGELFPLIEELCAEVVKECLGVAITHPFRQMDYQHCVEKYGTDKPDLRFGMELATLDDIAVQSSFSVFRTQLDQGGTVKGFCVKGGADFSRKRIDEYTSFVGRLGIAGLAWMKFQEGKLSSSIVKFFDDPLQKVLVERLGVERGDLIFMISDEKERTNMALDQLRRKIADDRGLIQPGHFEFLWVTNFPLFCWDQEERRLTSMHHPFTHPFPEDIPQLDVDPLQVRSSGYDLVLNGEEVGGGSQRIHDPEMQKKIFELLELTPEQIESKFGFFIEALQYGTPPHLGIALGLDRLLMSLLEIDSIRDVIAFPKTQKATDLMMQCPAPVSERQLRDLGLRIPEPSRV